MERGADRLVTAQFSAGAPPGMAGDRDPSRMSRRMTVAGLASAGAVVAGYLALYQLDVVGSVWDPFFGDGSERVLTSTLSRSLPVPDALLGAAAYVLEAVVELSGDGDRWYRQSWIVLLVGLLATALALTGVVLVVSQPVLAGTFCTLCLASAAISFAVAALVYEEVRAAVRSFRRPDDAQ